MGRISGLWLSWFSVAFRRSSKYEKLYGKEQWTGTMVFYIFQEAVWEGTLYWLSSFSLAFMRSSIRSCV